MADTIIDTLQVKVTANAQAATKSLQSLANALTKVRNTLTGMKDGVTVTEHLSKNLNDLNSALSQISMTGIRKLERLASALDEYATAMSKIKTATSSGSGVSKSIKSTEKALGVQTGEVASEDGVQNTKDFGGAVADAGDEVEKAGEKAKKATGFFNKFITSVKRILFYRAIRAALKAIGEAFSEGLKNAYYYSKQTGDLSKLAETLDRVSSKTQQMTNQLGAFWGELRQFAAPIIEWIEEKVISITQWLTELFAALNGDDYWQRALYVEQAWDDATDAVKKYKHQLLGLDELNNLSKNNDKLDGVQKAKEMFEDVPVGEGFKKVGAVWNSITQIIKDNLDVIEKAVYGAEVGIGAVLLFSGTHPILGLALIAHGAWKGIQKIKEDWDSTNKTVEEKLNDLGFIVDGAAFAIGVMLALSGNVGLGIGMMALAASDFGYKAVKRNWNKLPDRVQKEVDEFIIRTSAAELAIGAVLAFSGVSWKAGIPLMAAGVIGLWRETSEGNIDWGALPKKIADWCEEFFGLGGIIALSAGALAIGAILTFSSAHHIGLGIPLMVTGLTGLGYAASRIDWGATGQAVQDALTDFFGPGGLIACGTALLAIGAILLFTPHFLLGIAMIAAGAGGLALGISDINWDQVLDNLKGAWENIKNWWNSTVVEGIKKAVAWVEDKLSIDLNSDGQFGSESGYVVGSGTFTVREGSFADKLITFFGGGNIEGTRGSGGKGTHFALGGVPESGSLFYAGESGAEFVGSIGNSAAVANTGQMTDAIYKAAYMGMSKALKENGGGGMSGYEPATMDDLFIAMRKKSNEYNMTKGASAFA